MKHLLTKLRKKFTNWRLDKHKFRFKAYIGGFVTSTPVVTGSRIKAKWRKEQTHEGMKFHDCPGMLDYANSGYIVTAHTDIRIMANSVGIVIHIGATALPPHEEGRLQPADFDFKMVAGLAPIQEGVKGKASKIHVPWSVQFPPGYSAYVLAPFMHVDWLDKLFVYPGVVHLDKYHTLNFVFSAIKECDFVIPAGTPLLHILPFKREAYKAVCDKATAEEKDVHMFNMPSRVARYYRRLLADHKPPQMECPYDHRGK